MCMHFLLQEEEYEGIQMTKMVEQGTPGPVQLHRSPNCDLDTFRPTTLFSFEKQATLKVFIQFSGKAEGGLSRLRGLEPGE